MRKKPSGSAVAVRWYEEVKNADRAELTARNLAFAKKWTAIPKGGNPVALKSAAKAAFSLPGAAWLKARHTIASHPTWIGRRKGVTRRKLSAKLLFDRTGFQVAALNCGYGAAGVDLAEDPTGAWLDEAFAECMHLRTNYLLSTIDFAALRLQPFMSMFETSERADVSFLIGSATTCLVADEWLSAGGRKLAAFWHVSLYCAALVEGQLGTAFKNKDIGVNEKAPDFLAVDDKDGVHLFESKGGLAKHNPEVLRKALAQLATIGKVTLYKPGGKSAEATVLTRMAVRTVVEPDRQFSVLAYDPPDAAAGSHLRIDFDVARALQILESERLFATIEPPARWMDDDLWVRELEGTHLVMTSRAPYRELRSGLRAYLAVKQALPDDDFGPPDSTDDGSGEPPWRAIARDHGSRALANHDAGVQQQFESALEAARAPGALLLELSGSLGIADLVSACDRAIVSASLQLQTWGDEALRFRELPGLLIQLVDWDGDLRRKRIRPSVPKVKI